MWQAEEKADTILVSKSPQKWSKRRLNKESYVVSHGVYSKPSGLLGNALRLCLEKLNGPKKPPKTSPHSNLSKSLLNILSHFKCVCPAETEDIFLRPCQPSLPNKWLSVGLNFIYIAKMYLIFTGFSLSLSIIPPAHLEWRTLNIFMPFFIDPSRPQHRLCAQSW